jgi:hypothetical protein
VATGEVLAMQLFGGRNNRVTFHDLQYERPDAPGYLAATDSEDQALA